MDRRLPPVGERIMTTVDPVRDADERQVRLTEREALANVRTVLELCAAGELRCSDKTNRPTAATIRTIDAHLVHGDFYAEERIAAVAWPLLVQAGGLAKLDGTRLRLAPKGRPTRSAGASSVPPLRVLDSLGGLVLGAAAGRGDRLGRGRGRAAHARARHSCARRCSARASSSEINERVPPSRLLDAIARVDPFAAIRGPQAQVGAARPEAAPRAPGVEAARASVLRVTGTACGLGIEGSGWVAAPSLVVTNAHVVAGMKDARVDRGDGDFRDATRGRLRPARRRRRAAGRGARRAAAHARRPGRGQAGRDPRLPGERPLHRDAGPDRPDRRRAHRRRLRPRPGAPRASRPCAASSGTATPAGRRSTARGACRRRSSRRGSARRAGYAVPSSLVREALADAGAGARCRPAPACR